jgi:ABC-2 type transport system permease protein
MTAQIRAELLKIRSTRTTIGLILGMIALILLFTLLTGLLTVGGLAGVVLWGAIGAGLGAIIHNQVGAVITLLAWGLVVDNLLFGLVPAVGRFMPDRASDALMGLRVHHLLSPGAGAITLIAWAGALGVLGVALSVRQDIN